MSKQLMILTYIKIEEIYAPEVNDFVYITDDAYTANDIKQMELRILKVSSVLVYIEFKVNVS